MDKNELIEKLYELPGLIMNAELAVIKSTQAVQKAKESLSDHEDELRLSGVITGKNAEERTSQLRQNTQGHREIIQKAENSLSIDRISLNRLNNEQANYRAVAGMLKGVE